MSRRTRNINLTEGNIALQILIFAVPILLGDLFQNLYNSVDSLVVGNFVGKEALAAVNACSPITNLLVNFFVGMSAGTGVIFGRNFGAGNYQRLKDSIHTTVAFALIIGFSLAAVGIVFSGGLLRLVGCPTDIFDSAGTYLRVYTIGILFTAIYNIGAGVLRAVGDSRSPFYALVLSSVLNIVLDFVLVVNFRLGVLGVAFATIVSQFVSVIIIYRRMMIMDTRYAFRFRELAVDKEILKEVLDLGFPAGIQSCLISFSNMFVHRYINSFGSSATAGVGIATKLDRFVGRSSRAIGLGASTFVAQNAGAGKVERIKRGIWTCFLMSCISILIFAVPLYIFAYPLTGLFNSDPEVIRYGAMMMRTIIPFYFLQAGNQVLSGSLRGFGYSRQVMLLSLCGMILLRQIFLAVSMAINHTITNVYIGFPVGWGGACLAVALYYLYIRNKKHLFENLTKDI
ncbi:MAG: MATE family efflux transporter [Solobacterium sp.]|nr:MATE family efflux transporter [Solobacterium sp.]